MGIFECSRSQEGMAMKRIIARREKRWAQGIVVSDEESCFSVSFNKNIDLIMDLQSSTT